jgi:hypothetical protein
MWNDPKMLGVVPQRVLGTAALALALAACHAQQPGEGANQSSVSQAESATGQPEPTASSMEAGTHYLAATDNKTHGITFSLHINGTPAVSLNAPKMQLDIHSYMHSGPNTIVVGWQKQSAGGSGTLVIRSSTGKVAATESVSASAPASGEKTIKIDDK